MYNPVYFCVCIYVYAFVCMYPWKPEEGVIFPVNGVICACDMPDIGAWEQN